MGWPVHSFVRCSIRGWLVSACSRTRQPWLVGLLGGVLAWLGTGTNTVLTWGTALARTAPALANGCGCGPADGPRQEAQDKREEIEAARGGARMLTSHTRTNLAPARARNDDARFDSQGSSDIPPRIPTPSHPGLVPARTLLRHSSPPRFDRTFCHSLPFAWARRVPPHRQLFTF